MHHLNNEDELQGAESEDVTTSLELSDEERGHSDDDEEVEEVDFFTPEKLRGCRTTKILGSPSPIKKRCRPGSTSSDFSCFSVHTGDTPLNRSSLTTTTSETDEDDFDDDEWPDMDSSTVVARAPHCPSASRGLGGEGSEGYDIRHQPPPPLLYDDDEPVHRAGPSTLPAVQPEPQGPPRRLWAPADGVGDGTVGESKDAMGGAQERQAGTWAAPAPHKVIRIPPRSLNPFLPKQPAGPRRRSLEIKVPAGGSAPSLGPWTLSRYMLEFEEVGKLGEGRYSVVYKSIRRLDGCAYAVKRLAHRLRSEGDRSRVLREAYASAALADCPKLVRYHDAWIDDGHLHIQTELCPGGCLDRLAFPADYRTQAAPGVERVLEWCGSEGQLVGVLKDVALALHHMHQRHVVHMDVKPTNILVASDGSFKLGDLGHSVVTDGSMLLLEEGDQRYLSQEILAGVLLDSLKTRPDQLAPYLKAADIFALGATMYELASRTRLQPSGPEWHRLRSGQVPKIAHLSPGLMCLIEAMLHPEPLRRPSASKVLLQAIVLLVRATPNAGDFGGVREEETFVLSELIDNLREEQQQQHMQLQQQMQRQGILRTQSNNENRPPHNPRERYLSC